MTVWHSDKAFPERQALFLLWRRWAGFGKQPGPAKTASWIRRKRSTRQGRITFPLRLSACQSACQRRKV